MKTNYKFRKSVLHVIYQTLYTYFKFENYSRSVNNYLIKFVRENNTNTFVQDIDSQTKTFERYKNNFGPNPLRRTFI